jgi:hypothetical protein
MSACFLTLNAGAATPKSIPPNPYWEDLGVISEATEVGNGGFAVSCKKSAGGQSHWFYDLFLARFYGNFNQTPIEFGDLGYAEIINKILANYALLDKSSAYNLSAYFKNFWKKATTLPSEEKSHPFIEIKLGTLPFSHDIMMNCSMEQIISNVKRGSDYYYSIKMEKFLQLDELDKAVAILHELNYRDISVSGWAAHSRAVYSNMFVISLPDLSDASADEILTFQAKNVLTRKTNMFQKAQYGKYNIIINPPGAAAKVQSDNWTGSSSYDLTFYESYRIKEALLEPTRIETENLSLLVGERATFDLNGNLKQARLLIPSTAMIKIDSAYKKCTRYLRFNPDGDVIGCD